MLRKKQEKQSHSLYSQQNKTLGINLTNEVKDFYSETIKHKRKKLNKTLEDGKNTHVNCQNKYCEKLLYY
jgi:hypothetical protein